MHAIQLKEIFKATAPAQRASVQGMPQKVASIKARNSEFPPARFQASSVARVILWAFVLFFLQLAILMPSALAAGLQSNEDMPPQSEVASFSPTFNESLRPALQQVGNSVGQININRWKLPKSWKAQLQNDANSIQQDLSHQLPVLFQQAQASPTALDAQMRLMQNVDALYDVLVRLTMAANLTEKKSDAAILSNALEQLESARKTVTGQLLREAALENRRLVQLQVRAEENTSGENVSDHVKTIVVDNGNEVRHRTRRRATYHRKTAHPSTGTKSGTNAAQPSASKPSPKD